MTRSTFEAIYGMTANRGESDPLAEKMDTYLSSFVVFASVGLFGIVFALFGATAGGFGLLSVLIASIGGAGFIALAIHSACDILKLAKINT